MRQCILPVYVHIKHFKQPILTADPWEILRSRQRYLPRVDIVFHSDSNMTLTLMSICPSTVADTLMFLIQVLNLVHVGTLDILEECIPLIDIPVSIEAGGF